MVSVLVLDYTAMKELCRDHLCGKKGVFKIAAADATKRTDNDRKCKASVTVKLQR